MARIDENMKLVDYLKKMYSHLCIVGKFRRTGGEENPVLTVPFSEAAKSFRFELYYREESVEFDGGTEMKTVRLLAPRELRGLPDDVGTNAIRLPATVREKLKTVDTPAAEIGGMLFIELLDGLDAMLPYTHPDFDVLLTETFVEFAHAERSGPKLITRLLLREFLMRPEVNQRLTAYLRADCRNSADATEVGRRYLKSFEVAALLSAKRSAPGFALEPHIGWIKSTMEVFRTGLKGEPTVQDEADRLDKHLRRVPLENSAPLVKKLEALKIPRGPSGEPGQQWKDGEALGPYVRNVFRRFHDVRESVQTLVSCEPLQTFMAWWALSKFGDSYDSVANEIGRRFYRIEDPSEEVEILSDQQIAAIRNEIERELETALKQNEPNKQAVLDQAKARVMYTVDKAISWSQEYGWQRFEADMTAVFRDLLMLRLPGLAEFLNALDVESEVLCEVFMTYHAKLLGASGGAAPTGATLKEKLEAAMGRELAPPALGWVDGLAERCPETGGAELAAELRTSFTKEIVKRVKGQTDGFIEEKTGEIEAFGDQCKRIYAMMLRALRPEDSPDGIAQAAPGGTIGIVEFEDDGKKASPADTKRRKVRHAGALRDVIEGKIRERAAATAGSAGAEQPRDDHETAGAAGHSEAKSNPEGDDVAEEPVGEDAGVSFADSLSAEELDEISQMDGAKLVDWLGEKKIWNDDKTYLEPSVQAETEQGFESARRALIDENHLFTDPKLARERGLSRALLFGELVAALAREESVLSLRDRSVLVHFVLKMVQHVGADARWENKSPGGMGRAALLGKATKDAAGYERSGVLAMPMSTILGGAEKSGKAGIIRLHQVFENWKRRVDDVRRLVSELDEIELIETLLSHLARSGGVGCVTFVNQTLAEHAALPPEHQVVIGAHWGNNGCPVPPPAVVYLTQQAMEAKAEAADIRPINLRLFGRQEGDKGLDQAEASQNDAEEPPPLRKRDDGKTPYQKQESHPALYATPLFVGRKILGGEPFSGNAKKDAPLRLPAIQLDEPGIWEAVVQLMGYPVWTLVGDGRARVLREIARGHRVDSVINPGYRAEQAWREILVSDACLAQQYLACVGSAACFMRMRLGKEEVVPDYAIVSAVLDFLDERYGSGGESLLAKKFSVAASEEEEERNAPRGDGRWSRIEDPLRRVQIGRAGERQPATRLDVAARLVERL